MPNRRVRTGPVFFDEVRFDGNGRKDHLVSKQSVTSDEYTIYTSAETLPGWIVFISLQKFGNEPAGTVYCVPVDRVMSCKVAPRSLTRYQPLGTNEHYDTQSGVKKKYQAPKATSHS